MQWITGRSAPQSSMFLMHVTIAHPPMCCVRVARDIFASCSNHQTLHRLISPTTGWAQCQFALHASCTTIHEQPLLTLSIPICTYPKAHYGVFSSAPLSFFASFWVHHVHHRVSPLSIMRCKIEVEKSFASSYRTR